MRNYFDNNKFVDKMRHIEAQDREWLSAIPYDRFEAVDAKEAWGVCLSSTRRRLNLLRDSGLVRYVWCKTNKRIKGVCFAYWEKI